MPVRTITDLTNTRESLSNTCRLYKKDRKRLGANAVWQRKYQLVRDRLRNVTLALAYLRKTPYQAVENGAALYTGRYPNISEIVHALTTDTDWHRCLELKRQVRDWINETAFGPYPHWLLNSKQKEAVMRTNGIPRSNWADLLVQVYNLYLQGYTAKVPEFLGNCGVPAPYTVKAPEKSNEREQLITLLKGYVEQLENSSQDVARVQYFASCTPMPLPEMNGRTRWFMGDTDVRISFTIVRKPCESLTDSSSPPPAPPSSPSSSSED